jgi:MOSC domain-containing protein YiiM
MKIETVAVGEPRSVLHDGEEIQTSIFKRPVEGPVQVTRLGLAGDRQSDLRVHGGEFKAVYVYAAEHYEYWERLLGRKLEPASLGENLTVRGLDEPEVAIGDVFRMGEAELEATGPRLPCFKLGVRFADRAMVKAFARGGRYGLYFRVVKEGILARGDAVTLLLRPEPCVPVQVVARLALDGRDDVEAMRAVLAVPALDPSWRRHFLRKLTV